MSKKSGKSTNRSSANITNYHQNNSESLTSSDLGADILGAAVLIGAAYVFDKVMDSAIEQKTERQEKINKLRQAQSFEDDLFLNQKAKRVKIERYQTETSLIQSKVNLANKIADDFSTLPSGWKGAITHSSLNGGNSDVRQQIFNEELENLSVQEKQALLYKLQLQNQLDEHRNNQKMGYNDDD